MITASGASVLRTREKILADGLLAVASELRLIDVAELIDFVRAEKYSNIQDLIDSSVELYFRPGVLTFAWVAQTRLEWSAAPSISLDMEFRNRRITVFFCLQLEGHAASVGIRHIAFDVQPSDQDAGTRELREAIADALLPH